MDTLFVFPVTVPFNFDIICHLKSGRSLATLTCTHSNVPASERFFFPWKFFSVYLTRWFYRDMSTRYRAKPFVSLYVRSRPYRHFRTSSHESSLNNLVHWAKPSTPKTVEFPSSAIWILDISRIKSTHKNAFVLFSFLFVQLSKGMWPEGADGTDINACSRSNSAQYLANGDDSGAVNLFKYPCPKPKV